MMKKRIVFAITFLVLVIATGAVTVLSLRSQKPDIITSPLSALGILPSPTPASFIIYGYLPYWTAKSASIPTTLTDISFFSLPIHVDGHLFPARNPPDPGYRMFQQGFLEDLRDKAAGRRINLTLTMMDQEEIPTFLATPSAALTLVSDIDTLLAEHKLDGINIDIEYIKTTDDTIRSQFTSFLKTLYTRVKQTHPKLSVSVAVLADSAQRQRLTDIAAIAPYTDHIIIMAYDFHRRGSSQSGANAPLYGDSDEKWGKNIMSSAKAFTDLVPASKLILGVPFYGYEWSVTDDNAYNFTLPNSGKTATYERITNLLATGKATRHWDSASFTPYLLYQQNGKQQQIYYEDAQSLAYKLDLVKQAGFSGIAIWAMGYEGSTTELWQTIESILR